MVVRLREPRVFRGRVCPRKRIRIIPETPIEEIREKARSSIEIRFHIQHRVDRDHGVQTGRSLLLYTMVVQNERMESQPYECSQHGQFRKTEKAVSSWFCSSSLSIISPITVIPAKLIKVTLKLSTYRQAKPVSLKTDQLWSSSTILNLKISMFY